MSSSLSSDELIKHEIINNIGYSVGNINLRIFPESSTLDQELFSNGGLTFGKDGVAYGSCDAVWYIPNTEYMCPFDNSIINDYPVVALEGTDALQRGSSGNAQYQRFHHALGAVRAGVIGVYYLKNGTSKLRPELYGMAYKVSIEEDGYYFIIQDLNILKELLNLINNYGRFHDKTINFMDNLLSLQLKQFNELCFSKYDYNWNSFANRRSTIIFEEEGYVVKHAGRMKRNFTDSSQRAGHIAVGEMYLTRAFFYDKKLLYLFPKMSRDEIIYLDDVKYNDKEWYLLRNEPNVTIITRDEIVNLPSEIYKTLTDISDKPLKGEVLKLYNCCVKNIVEGLKNGTMYIDNSFI